MDCLRFRGRGLGQGQMGSHCRHRYLSQRIGTDEYDETVVDASI